MSNYSRWWIKSLWLLCARCCRSAESFCAGCKRGLFLRAVFSYCEPLGMLLKSLPLPIDCCPFVPPSISITKTLFSHRLGSLTQPLLQIPCSHGEWETRGWQSFSFPLQKDALLVLRRGQLWSRCCDASLALAYSRDTQTWSRRGERGETYSHPSHCEQHRVCYRQHCESEYNNVFFNMPGRYKWIFGPLITMYNIWICLWSCL